MSNKGTEFKKGNQFYKLRLVDGVSAKYKPDALLAKAEEYLIEVFENPIELPKYKGDKEPVIKPRPMSIRGFCVFAGITTTTFNTYEKKSDFLEVCKFIKDSTQSYQLDYATIGAFKENIVARQIGLADNNNIKASVQDITGMTIE